MNRTILLVGASGAQVGLSAILGLLLAWLLPAPDFGVTRVVTSYMIVLTMFGHCALHDAASAYVATAGDRRSASAYYHAALVLTAGISLVVGLIAGAVMRFSGWWSGPLASALGISALSLPFVTTAIVGSTVLQAMGGYRRLVVNQVLAGVVPLVVIFPLAWLYGLDGWVYGRFAAVALYCIATFGCLKGLFEPSGVSREVTRDLIGFVRFQAVSGFLSLFLMSADIIILERSRADLQTLADYGLASMVIKFLFFIPSAVGRAHFKGLADARSRQQLTASVRAFATTSLAGVAGLYVLIAVAAGIAAHLGLMDKYRGAMTLLLWLGPTAALGTLWQVMAVLNTCRKNPRIAMNMSALASIVMLAGGYLLSKVAGGSGMSVALGLAYLSGLVYGWHSWRKPAEGLAG